MDRHQSDNREHLGRRITVMLLGLSLLAVGIAMSKKAAIGTSPISCIPATLTDCLPETGLTIGNWTIIFNLLLVILQIVLLGKGYKPIQLLQLGLAVFLGYVTDFAMDYLLFWMSADTYVMQWVFCVLACAIIGFGVMMQIRANVLVVPGDALVIIIASKVKKLQFHKVKIMFDASMTIIACVISVLLVGGFTGAREGTIFAALAVGTFIGFYRARFGKYVDRLLGIRKE